MQENSVKSISTPRKQKVISGEEPSRKKFPKQSGYSIASTEIHSNKNLSLEENNTPKKKPKSKMEAIKTFCRIRPCKSQNELFSISKSDDRILNINSSILDKLNVGNNLKLINSYKFSKVFDENSTQEEVFELTCKPLLEDFIFNQKSGLVFTYGMTNAGKTYTVIGTPECPGILPLALKNLLEYEEILKMKGQKNYHNFYCNFVEIYNEDIFDLLSDDPSGKNKYYKKKLTIKENLNSVFFLPEVTFAKLDNLESFNNILNKGISKKVHSSTVLNENSSRSHTIFKIIFFKENKDINKLDFSTEELISLSVVDLAGSERQKRTDAKGKNLQEACKINQSLSTLGKCLEAMKHNSVSNNKKMVPLRESKLTKIFAEYFQGDQNIIMITNINPRNEDFEESIRALNYSCIAKDIKPIKSVIPKFSSSGNELKMQIKKEKEKKLNEIQNSNNINNNMNNNNTDNNNNPNNINYDKKNEEFNNIDDNLPGKNDNNNNKLNDSLTLNLNELFNSNSNFDDMIDHEMKTEFTKAPEDNSTKEEIAKLMNEINKLREEVNEFKNEKSEFQKSKIFGLQSETQSIKGISYDKNKLNYMNMNNNLRPFSQFSQSETNNFKFLGNNNELNMPGFNCNDSILSQEPNNFSNTNNNSCNFFGGINTSFQNNNPLFPPQNNFNNNSMLTPYGNYGYPFNNPFLPFYGGANIFGNSILPLPDANTDNKKNKAANKKGKKNKNINEMINNYLGNIVPGISRGVNLIFINSKFGNLIPGQSIQEERIEFSDTDDENGTGKKRKIKGTPKKKKKNKVRNQTQKTYPKMKIRPKYPIKKDNNGDIIEEEKDDNKENENDNEYRESVADNS